MTRRTKVFVVMAALPCVCLGGFLIGAYLWAGHQYREAEQKISKRDFAGAHTHLEAYLTVHQYDGEAHFLAARTARRAELMDDARRHLEDCKRLGSPPRDSIALERMLIKVQLGEVGESEEYLLSCVEGDHEDAALILEALIEGYQRSFKVSIAELCANILVQRQPDNPFAYLCRGELHDHGLSVQPAIVDYQKALELDPDLDRARIRLAENLIHTKRVPEALPHFEHLHAKHPEDLRVRVGLAECYADGGDLAEARDLLDAVLAEMASDDPRAFEAMTQRAKIATLLDQPADAEKWSRRALAVVSDSQENLFTLYRSLDLLGRHDEARDYEAKWRSGDDEARRIEMLLGRIAENPGDPSPRHEIGIFHLRQGRDNLGLTWLVSALQAEPLYRPTLLALADYYEKKGDEVRVKEFRRRAEINAAPPGDGTSPPGGRH
jgi:tetratricopeptide (TPR) repeat protein